MSKYKFNNGYIYRNGFRVPMPCVVVVLNEMQQKLEAYIKELPNFKATRENLEKIAKDAQGDFVEVEQEGEKWTHTFGDDSCYIKVSEPDLEGFIVIVTEESGYILCQPEKIKPIKPTMTKEQHEFLCKFSADSNNLEVIAEVESYLAKHEVIEG